MDNLFSELKNRSFRIATDDSGALLPSHPLWPEAPKFASQMPLFYNAHDNDLWTSHNGMACLCPTPSTTETVDEVNAANLKSSAEKWAGLEPPDNF
jgi:hypothetical protein